jgi:hypothetical protein
MTAMQTKRIGDVLGRLAFMPLDRSSHLKMYGIFQHVQKNANRRLRLGYITLTEAAPEKIEADPAGQTGVSTDVRHHDA